VFKLKIIALALALSATSVAAHKKGCTDSNALALNMYHEARGEGSDGMQMVGEVTLNRVKSSRYPNTICKVVYQHKQFSWTHTVSNHTPHEKKLWSEAKEIAAKLMSGKAELFDNGATHFLNPKAVKHMPRWARKFEVVGRVGNHVFYEHDT